MHTFWEPWVVALTWRRRSRSNTSHFMYRNIEVKSFEACLCGAKNIFYFFLFLCFKDNWYLNIFLNYFIHWESMKLKKKKLWKIDSKILKCHFKKNVLNKSRQFDKLIMFPAWWFVKYCKEGGKAQKVLIVAKSFLAVNRCVWLNFFLILYLFTTQLPKGFFYCMVWSFILRYCWAHYQYVLTLGGIEIVPIYLKFKKFKKYRVQNGGIHSI